MLISRRHAAAVHKMSDPLLTSLCGICHTREPKYKCPRCNAKTCSLACVSKHKKWSSCSGERDPTVFVPPSKLRTDAGIDHDYNFLTKIERKVEQAEKIFSEERGIIPPQSQGPPPNKRARLHKGQSRGKTTLSENSRPWARMAVRRLRELNINLINQPFGMSRARENTTSYNKKKSAINWQVEWLVLDSDTKLPPTKLLHKTLEDTPLYVAFAEGQEKQRLGQLSQEERDKEKREQKLKRREELRVGEGLIDEGGYAVQNPSSSTWQDAAEKMQNPVNARWNVTSENRRPKWEESAIEADKDGYQFYFGKAVTPQRNSPNQKLVPVEPTDTLGSVLKGEVIVEFPTIYVLSAGSALPEGFVIEKRAKDTSKKRKGSSLLADYGTDEEGEEDGKDSGHKSDLETGSDAGFEFDDDQTRAQFLEEATLEEGELQGADTTSSEGSDTDSDSSDGDMDMD
jgi:hypothetical protein